MRTSAAAIPSILAALAIACVPARGADDGSTWPFNPPVDKFTDAALLDLRSLNERVAGETGFVRRSPDGNSFVRGDGKPIRFWGVGSGLYRKSVADIEQHCRFLAKMGVNMVRLHADVSNTKDGAKLTDVNDKEIDGILRFVHVAKRHGIYTTISPWWAHAKAPPSWHVEGYDNAELWGVMFFNPDLQAAYKAWTRELYTRKHPDTGVALKDEPAVAIVQIMNEDSLLFWTFSKIKDPQMRILAKQYAQWLTQKYGSLDKALAEYGDARLKQDDPANTIVWFYPTFDLLQKAAGGKAKRLADQTEFLTVRQRQFYADMVAHYRSIGCKQLTNAMNWRSADAVRLDDAERWSYTATDVIAVNRYTGVIHTGANNGYRIDPGHQFVSESCLTHPLTLPVGLKQVDGHPMIVTESAWVHPTLYQSEGPFLAAAYQSLNGVDCTYWFATGETTWLADPRRTFWPVGNSFAIDKWSVATPMGIGQFPANALAFRQGYVDEAPQPAVYEERAAADVWQRKVPVISEAEKFDPNRDQGDFAAASSVKQEVDPLAFLVGPVRVKVGGDPAKTAVSPLLAQCIDRNAHTVRSLTNQILLNYDAGWCAVVSARFHGVSGFLKKGGGTYKLALATIKSDNDYATIAVTSLDAQPLNAAKRILIQVGTTARLGGWETKPVKVTKDKQELDGEEIVNTGTPPWRVVNTKATVTIQNTKLTRARWLNMAGYAAGDVPLKISDTGVELELPPNAMYLVLD